MDPTFADNRNQDRSRKHKHSGKSKGKGRADTDPSGGAGEGKSLAYNVPQHSSDMAPQGDYYQNYSHYGSATGQSYRTSSYAGQSDYGAQREYAPSQGQLQSVRLAGNDTDLSPRKRRHTVPAVLIHHPLPRETSPTFPLKPLWAAPMETWSLSLEICTSKEAEAEAEDRRQVVSTNDK